MPHVQTKINLTLYMLNSSSINPHRMKTMDRTSSLNNQVKTGCSNESTLIFNIRHFHLKVSRVQESEDDPPSPGRIKFTQVVLFLFVKIFLSIKLSRRKQ